MAGCDGYFRRLIVKEMWTMVKIVGLIAEHHLAYVEVTSQNADRKSHYADEVA